MKVKLSRYFILVIICLVFNVSLLWSSEIFNKELSRIEITGNDKVYESEILGLLQAETGKSVNELKLLLNEGFKRIWNTNKFVDMKFSLLPLSDGKVALQILVEEKMIIRKISFSGNKNIKAKDLKEKIKLTAGDYVERFSIRQAVEEIRVFYKEKEYYEVKILPELKKLGNQEVELNIFIQEGIKLKINEIKISGNKIFSDKEILGTIPI